MIKTIKFSRNRKRVAMGLEENKAVVVRYYKEVMEQGHMEVLEEIYTPEGNPPDSWGTVENWKNVVLWHRKHCPGFKANLPDVMAEGDWVIAHVQFELTYSVPVDPSGSPASYPLGKPLSWHNFEMFRLVNGKIVFARASFPSRTDALVKVGMYKREVVV
jgi:predicted SnoaL-like aldol condensation-catalyzing enzyme